MSNSVRMIAPVGQASRQPACTQCLQTSLSISQLLWNGCIELGRRPLPSPTCSTNATCRQVAAPRSPVLS